MPPTLPAAEAGRPRPSPRLASRPSLLPVVAGAAVIAVAGGALAVFAGLTARRVERAMPPEGAFAEVDGARLHYVDTGAPHGGSGPAIVMIHGLAGQLRHFTYALTGRLSGDHRVVAVDRPGAGRSRAAARAGQSIRVQARYVAALIRRLGLEQPLVVGHSLGGAVALALALDHPDVVGGLALVAPLTQPMEEAAVSPVFRTLMVRSPLVRRVIAWTLAVPSAMRGGARALETVFGPEPVVEDFGGRGGGALGLHPRAFESASADLLAAAEDLPGMVERYPTLTLPIGMLYGSHDRLLDIQLHGHGVLAHLATAELEVAPDAGHMILMTRPDLTADFVRRTAARMDRSA